MSCNQVEASLNMFTSIWYDMLYAKSLHAVETYFKKTYFIALRMGCSTGYNALSTQCIA